MPQAEAPRKARSWRGALCTGLVVLTGLVGGGVWYSLEPLPEDLLIGATELDRELLRAEALSFSPGQYQAYRERLLALRQRFLVERRRAKPWQDRPALMSAARELEHEGRSLLAVCLEEHRARRLRIERAVTSESEQLARLRVLVRWFDVDSVTPALSLTQALLEEARHYLEAEDLDRARRAALTATARIRRAERKALAQMQRYSDRSALGTWRRWVKETVQWTRRTGQPAVVVLKAERWLRVYEAGTVRREFPVQLGYNGLADKLYEGDGATPEGRFTVLAKKEKRETRFHKALLLSYPTTEHRRRLQSAKAEGRLPGPRRSGGLIEIHGQGPDSSEATNGCIALDNDDMDAVFAMVSAGTPVTVVGTVEEGNTVSRQAEAVEAHIRDRALSLSATPDQT